METTLRNRLMWRWSLVSAALIGAFWLIWYLATGNMPEVTSLKMTETWSLALPFGLPRWCDLFLGPLFVCPYVYIFSLALNAPERTEMHMLGTDGPEIEAASEPIPDMIMGATIGFVVILIVDLIWGVGIGLIVGLVFGTIFGLSGLEAKHGLGPEIGLVFGSGAGLAIGLIHGLEAGLGYGSSLILVVGLSYGLATGLRLGVGAVLCGRLNTSLFKKACATTGQWLAGE